MARTEVARVQLAALQETNVLNDAFHIWHDNEFGTINSFRLGRLPRIHVSVGKCEVLVSNWDDDDVAGENRLSGFDIRCARLVTGVASWGWQVEWDEINAAWGQASMLLYTMAQTCRLNFS